jgi:hypothetical protein
MQTRVVEAPDVELEVAEKGAARRCLNRCGRINGKME